MKKIFYVASMACLFLFSGCDDFLTVESPDVPTDGYWMSKRNVEAGLAAVYSQLENCTDEFEFTEHKYTVEEFRGDCVETGSDVDGYPEWGAMYTYTYDNENSRVKEYWMNNYNGITYANNVIHGIETLQASDSNEKLSTDDENYLMGEAKFLRAYFHFKLLMNWKEIIIREDYLENEEQTHKALSTREEAWEKICGWFDEAGKLLPETRPDEEAGRVTKNAAYAYLGWAYLTRAWEDNSNRAKFMDNAEKALDNVKYGNVGLVGDNDGQRFVSMFDGTNKNSKESIFELQFTKTTSDGALYKHTLHYWLATPGKPLNGWDEIRVSEKLYNALTEEKDASGIPVDERAYATIIFDAPRFNNQADLANGSIMTKFYYTKDDANKTKVYYSYDDIIKKNGTAQTKGIKYSFKKFFPESYEDYQQSSIATNIPLMRYANVLLMKAEIYNESNATRNKAIDLINRVRKAHGGSSMTDRPQNATQDKVQEYIEHERMVDFAMECYRFYDLRRWGKLSEVSNSKRTIQDTDAYYWLPVPLMEIQSNNKVD